ncbi:hypothetical protein VNI00_004947 [Paramarasmius palmivorus]|uniref:Uncharacterized protein n=1 Tax=Paramarasmius palmivorus TaxID=297713 RepID=A0AAW0DK00_9AGAR
MFKRVDRKRKRKAEEEALGLDEEMKEILGMQDTDSDESDNSASEVDDEGDSDSEAGDDEEINEEEDEIEDAEEDEESEPEDEEEYRPTIPLHKAVSSPLYEILDATACLVCPGKVLKTPDLEDTHKKSKACMIWFVSQFAHLRRFKRFTALAKDADQDANAWDIVDLMAREDTMKPIPSQSSVSSETTSKRAAKKKARREFIKNKHTERKAATRAKRETASQADAAEPKAVDQQPPKKQSAPTVTSKSPPSKKQKIQGGSLHNAKSKAKAGKLKGADGTPKKAVGKTKPLDMARKHKGAKLQKS